jgi:type IV pilus assembly protein PilZ
VKWVVTPADADADSPAGMGIEFQYENDEERRATEAIVERLMANELGEGLAARLLGKRGGDEPSEAEPSHPGGAEGRARE